MSNRKLPEGYYRPDKKEAAHLHAELRRELPEGHLLFNVLVETFAAREGNDDTLYQHLDEPDRFTLVHLTWLGRTEINTSHPTIEFDGSFADFLVWEEQTYGVKPKTSPSYPNN